MNQPRVDLYTAIHKSLRAIMYETGGLLERTNFADADERKAALTSAKRTLAFFDEHLALENEFIAPHVKAAAEPDLAEELMGQHADHEELSEAMGELFEELEQADSAEVLGLGFELCKLFNVMVADQSQHMNLEERDANTALWEAKSDAELVEIRTALQASVAPPRMAQWLSIMVPNLNHQELVGMLGGMKQSAPAEVFDKVCGMAKPLLGERWAPIEAELG